MMKPTKMLSVFLSLVLLCSCTTIQCYAQTEVTLTDDIKEFSNEIIEILSEYDSNKEFVVSSSENTTAPISDPTIWTPNGENIESDETTEDTTLNPCAGKQQNAYKIYSTDKNTPTKTLFPKSLRP